MENIYLEMKPASSIRESLTNIKGWILFFFTGYFLILCFGLKKKEPRNPNFLIIQTDDLGFDDLPLHGNAYVETPNLDQLATESVVFQNFYVNPVCAPTRASLLTGKDFLLTGVSHVHGGKDFIHLEEKTFADFFQQNGYATGMWGKWHSGKTEGYFPWQRGFEEAYMANLYRHRKAGGLLNGDEVEHAGKWSDQVLADYALDFMQRNKDKPFLAYLSSLTCHGPLDAKEEIVKKYEDKNLPHHLAKLYAMIEQLDIELGRLFQGMEELGLAENTVVLFLSDNGPAFNGDIFTDADRSIRYHTGYKGHKGNIWNNGVKSSLLLRYGNTFAPRKTELLCDVTDLFPTIAELAGLDLGRLEVTGISFAQNLLQKKDSRPEKIVFNYADRGWPPTNEPYSPLGKKEEYMPYPDKGSNAYLSYKEQILSVQNERFKLLHHASYLANPISNAEGYALIDVKNDPLENYNVLDKNIEAFQQLKNALQNKYMAYMENKKAFQAVEFQLKKDKSKKVLTYAPYSTSEDLQITALYSTPWNQANMEATYSISVQDAMLCKPMLQSKTKNPPAHFVLEIEGQRAKVVRIEEFTIYFEPISLTPGKKRMRLYTINSSTEPVELVELEFLEE